MTNRIRREPDWSSVQDEEEATAVATKTVELTDQDVEDLVTVIRFFNVTRGLTEEHERARRLHVLAERLQRSD